MKLWLFIGIFVSCQIGTASESVPNELLFKFKGEAPQKEEFAVFSQLEALGGQISFSSELVGGLHQLKFKNETATEKAKTLLSQNPSIEYVQPNYIRRTQEVGRNYGYDVSGLKSVASKARPPIPEIEAPPASWTKDPKLESNFGTFQNKTRAVWKKYNFFGSPKTIIAVLDTGIDYTHRDLRQNLWRNPGESGLDQNGKRKEINGVDDDGNGFIDDVVGYDFAANEPLPYDDNDHGTHVSGIAAASVGNGFGAAGHCPRCSIMGLKFITKEGWGSDADAIKGLEYAVKMKATVINSSWGSEEYSQALFDAFQATSEAGIINVVAAGNSGKDLNNNPGYPAKFKVKGLFAVSALYEANVFMPFWSNYGTSVVHLSSAGVSVTSSVPGDKFASFSGTSMASPGVAGGIGLIKSFRPKITNSELYRLLKKHVFPDQSSISKVMFKGRPNLEKIFAELATTPAEAE